MNHKIPSFIGIGGQKCASTWLYRILQDHPQAIVSTPKELDFFSNNYDRGYQWYQAFFDILPETKVSGEISPSYLHHLDAPARAARYNPDFRIQVVLRDPIARAYSNHLHEIRLGHYCGPDYSFEAGMKNNPMYLEQSRYYYYLRHWFDCFPKDRIQVLFLEEIHHNPILQAEKFFTFLGIDPDHKSAFLLRKANESTRENIPGFDGLLKKAGRAGRRLVGQNLVNTIKNMPQIVKLREANRSHLTKDIPPMEDLTEQLLVEELSEDIQNLAMLLGLNSLPWKTWDSMKF